LPSQHYISNFTLRVERSEQSSKVKYRVFALSEKGKRCIGSGAILEHQWTQISKEIYKQGTEEIFENIKNLNIYGLTLEPTVAQYLEI
jgi:bisphosphoglycerate-independent phosphoglycerate mutase (AlkP superfamily)